MFSGIVQGTGMVSKVISNKDHISLEISAPKNFNKGLKKGACISVDGVCQLRDQMESCINMSQAELDLARSVSVANSASFTEEVYASSINKILRRHADILTNYIIG